MIKKEYAELNRPNELIIDKAEYIKILKEEDILLFLIKKVLGKDV